MPWWARRRPPQQRSGPWAWPIWSPPGRAASIGSRPRMSLLCPNCRTRIDPASGECANGHAFAEVEGVLPLLADGFGQRLAAYEAVLSAARRAEGKHLLEVTAYEQLPFS